MYKGNTAVYMVNNAQKKIIYTLGNELGLVDRMAARDTLHEMILSITGKDRVSDLTNNEARMVIDRLKSNMKGASRIEPKPKTENMASEREIKKIWALLFELKKYDETGEHASMQKRLRGFLKKYAGIDDVRFLTHEKANAVIEGLKGLVRTQKKKTSKEV
jgi:hypothetical protein